jgi:hypothetical protein
MEGLAQLVSLSLFLLLLFTGTFLVSRQEIADVFHKSGRLGRHCQAHASACEEGDIHDCLRAVGNLEDVEHNLICWRTHFVGSVFVGLTTLLVALACFLPPGKTTLLVLTSFLATSVAFRYQHSWHGAHVAKHTREARRHCLQKMADAKTIWTQNYY